MYEIIHIIHISHDLTAREDTDPAPNVWLHSSVGKAEVKGSNPVEAVIFFRLLSNCSNWKIYCDDHTSLSKKG